MKQEQVRIYLLAANAWYGDTEGHSEAAKQRGAMSGSEKADFHDKQAKELDLQSFKALPSQGGDVPKNPKEARLMREARDAHLKSSNAFGSNTKADHHKAWVAHEDLARKLNFESGGNITHPFQRIRTKHLRYAEEHRRAEHFATT